jgi:hypothetical protein
MNQLVDQDALGQGILQQVETLIEIDRFARREPAVDLAGTAADLLGELLLRQKRERRRLDRSAEAGETLHGEQEFRDDFAER